MEVETMIASTPETWYVERWAYLHTTQGTKVFVSSFELASPPPPDTWCEDEGMLLVQPFDLSYRIKNDPTRD